MLCLTLRDNQEFSVGRAKIIIRRKGNYFRAYINAPKNMDISRGEIIPDPNAEEKEKREKERREKKKLEIRERDKILMQEFMKEKKDV